MGKKKTESIAARIYRLRKEKGLAQREIASENISHTYISRIEAGERSPSVTAIRDIAAKLGVTPFYLEHGYQEMVSVVFVHMNGGDRAVAVYHEEDEADKLAQFLSDQGHAASVQREPVDDGEATDAIKAQYANA